MLGKRGSACIAGSILGLAGVLEAGSARAGNDESFSFGDQASLTGGAVLASIGDTASIYYNPAGLGRNRRGRIELSGTAFSLRERRNSRGLAIDLPSGRVEQFIESRQIYVVPSALAAVREVLPGLSVGLGLFVTEEDLFNFEATLKASDALTNLELSGALTGTILRYNAGPSIGYQVSPDLRIGASLLGVYEDQHEFRKLFADARMQGTYQSTFLQRLVDAKSSRLGLELTIGAQVEVGDGWAIGLAMRSPRWVFHESAAADNSTALISRSMSAPTVASSMVDHDLIGAEGTGFTRPPRFSGGFSKRLGAIEASLDLEARPSGIGPTTARAVWNARGGFLWYAGSETILGLGLFTDRSGAGVPATFPDYRVDYYGISAGWKRLNSVRVVSEESSTTLTFSTTVAVRYAFAVGDATRIRFDFTDTRNSGIVGRIADERVDVVYHEASLYLGTGLEF